MQTPRKRIIARKNMTVTTNRDENELNALVYSDRDGKDGTSCHISKKLDGVIVLGATNKVMIHLNGREARTLYRLLKKHYEKNGTDEWNY